jgi:DinB superfamily
MKRPKRDEYSSFHATYIDVLPPKSSVKTLLNQAWKETVQLLSKLPEEQGNFAYEPGKWTIKQLLLHCIDTERVFAHRVMWWMRGDKAALPGFNQEFWMEFADVNQRTTKDLLKEWKVVRDNTLFLLNNCSEAQSLQRGTASNFNSSVRAYFYIIAGHHTHHLNVFKAKYLPLLPKDA